MLHFFDETVATAYGVKEAIIFQNFAYWVEYNERSEINFIDGKYWTYNSYEALVRHFPYWTAKQIRDGINTLEINDLIEKGDFSEDRFRKVNYYTLTEKGRNLLSKSNDVLTKKSAVPDEKVSSLIYSDLNSYNRNLREETPQTPHSEKSAREETLEPQKLPESKKPFEPTKEKGFISKDGVLTSHGDDTDDDKPKRDSWAEFGRFWESYPNATRQQATLDMFQRLIFQGLLPPIDELLSILEKHKKRWDDPKYIPSSYNWLKDLRWGDKETPGKKEAVNEYGVPFEIVETYTASELTKYMQEHRLGVWSTKDKVEGEQ